MRERLQQQQTAIGWSKWLSPFRSCAKVWRCFGNRSGLSSLCLAVSMHSPLPQPFAHGFPQATPADDFSFKREKSALSKLQVKGGDSTSVTRAINERLQKTALPLNTWSASAVQLWHHAVATARAAHQQWTLTAPSQLLQDMPPTAALRSQISALEATMQADLSYQIKPNL